VWSDPGEPCGLGTSGAGDVLAGAVGGLGARCHDGPQAACWATTAHRVASNRLAAQRAPMGYLARELADELAPSLAELGRVHHNGDRPREEPGGSTLGA
jgi:NAD(P)H-hydrate repair Nnr-like enzyme with NAD(P)H-hydrate dehydratase domain